LVITEIMVDPQDCEDVEAEWFEVYNNTDDWVDLHGLVVETNGATASTYTNGWAAPRSLFLGVLLTVLNLAH